MNDAYSAHYAKTTHVGTQNGAYKGNLGAKLLLFFQISKLFCKKSQKFIKKLLQIRFSNRTYLTMNQFSILKE